VGGSTAVELESRVFERCLSEGGTHAGLPEFHLRRVPGARFSRSDGEPFFFEPDGELMVNPVTELEVLVRAHALLVVGPRGWGRRI